MADADRGTSPPDNQIGAVSTITLQRVEIIDSGISPENLPPVLDYRRPIPREPFRRMTEIVMD